MTRCAVRRAGGYRPAAGSALAEGDPAADRGALSRIRRMAARYRRRMRTDAPADGDPGRLLAAAFPDRIAQRRGEPGSWLAGGGGARVAARRTTASAPLLAVASLELKASARISWRRRSIPTPCPPLASPSRWRPASIRSPAQCWRVGAGVSGRWC